MTEDLESLCKQLHISGMFQFISEHMSENPGIEAFLVSTCKAEISLSYPIGKNYSPDETIQEGRFTDLG